MHTIELLRALRAMPVLQDLSAGTVTVDELTRLGYRDAPAWAAMSATYYGPTRFKALQETARDAAAELSLDALMTIEKHTRKLLREAPVTPWELRVELCSLRGTVPEIDRAAAARVRELNRQVDNAEQKAWGHRALKGGKNTDPLGLRTFTVTGPERHIEAYPSQVRTHARRLRRDTPQLSYEQAMFDALMASTGGGHPGPVPPIPHVVVPVPDWARVLRHEGDETIFALTDGTTMTGAQLLAEVTAAHHIASLYHPVEGPVNAYRSERTASPKQRMLLAVESLLCEGPECTTPADQCEVHHLRAWKKGGETNIANLTMLCRKHNTRNDDDPDEPPRNGRFERRPGGVVFLPPDGGPPRTNRHPLRRLSARDDNTPSATGG